LEHIVSSGEVLNPPAWEWLQREVLEDRVPVLDHTWETETGGPIIANPSGIAMLPIKPGSAGIPVPGIRVGIIAPEGTFCAANEKGIFVITRPFPGLTASLWGDPERSGG
jgi:acetyl-CoA synthetase